MSSRSAKKQEEIINLRTPTKFNLNPELQHVQASFMDTGKTVEKMLKQKEERVKELKDSRKVWMGDRFFDNSAAESKKK